MKKRLDITLIKKMFLLSLWTVPVVSQADDIVVADGMWKITYMESEKAFRINVLNEGGAARKCVVNHSVSVARYDNAEGVAREVTTASFADVARAEEAVDNEFGAGKCYTFTFSRPDNGDEVAINKVGDIVILMPKENKWSAFLNSLELFSDDFMSDGREQPAVQEREAL